MSGEQVKRNIDVCRAKLHAASVNFPVPEICAVTKTMPPEIANFAYDAGVTRIGENRVQELKEKFPALNPCFAVDLIGQLQTNKVKYIMDLVDRVQSLDRMALAQEIDRRAQAAGRVMPCLIEVNVARESQRGGVMEEDLLPFVRQVSQLKGIGIEGLMAVMPIASEPEAVRPLFRKMRVWFDRLRQEGMEGVSMQTLSMGMTHDYEIAAQEGATLVRIGSAIFGRRI